MENNNSNDNINNDYIERNPFELRRELEIDIEVLVKKRITLNIKTVQGVTDPDVIEDHIKDVFSDDPDADHLCFEDSIFEVVDMHVDSEETKDVDVTIL